MPPVLFHDLDYLVEKHSQTPRQLARTFGITRAEAEGQVRAAKYDGCAPWQAPAPEDRPTTVKKI
jgi:hypothetical protein